LIARLDLTMSVLKVAAAQIECRPGDISANRALHLAAIDEARGRGVDVLVFPELSLTDYLAAPDAPALARASTGPELAKLAEAAGPVTVAAGFIEKGENGRFYNAQALLRDGRLLHVHRKVNLPTYGRLEEGNYFTPGRRIDVAQITQPWTAATLVCADTWNPALPWLAALQGASLLLVPVASSLDAVGGNFDNTAGWDLNLRHTALTYGLPIVMANHCGTRGGLRFWGGSRVLDAFGREMARAGAEPALLVAEIDIRDVHAARSRLPTIRDADPVLVQGELARLLHDM
jgi:predicted amidohydrolase